MSVHIPKVTLGFLVIILSTVAVLACVLTKEHRIAFILGMGGIAASFAMLLMLVIFPAESYAAGVAVKSATWLQLHADLFALAVGLLCDVAGSAGCVFWLRRQNSTGNPKSKIQNPKSL